MASSSAHSHVKTRILIISDTHGEVFPECMGLSADVAIHCGDLTDGSKLSEFETTLRHLGNIDAPLKLVIAGNHDFTLDTPAYQRIVSELPRDITKEDLDGEYGAPGQARALLAHSSSGIIILDEGSHQFKLANGALLSVFASPFTPSATASMGFQYITKPVSFLSPGASTSSTGELTGTYFDGHAWPIQKGTHLVITHGPPRGVFDRNHEGVRAGSEGLFAAVAAARPLIHCFGHIHEGWGAKLVTWRGLANSDVPSHFTCIDNDKSETIETLASLTPREVDSVEVTNEKQMRLERYRREKACFADFSHENGTPIHEGEQTVFVNAAMEGTLQLPWVVNLDLSRG